MNLLARAKLSINHILHSHAKPTFSLLPFTTPATQHSHYATKAAATQSTTKPRTKKPSQSTGSSRRVKEQDLASPKANNNEDVKNYSEEKVVTPECRADETETRNENVEYKAASQETRQSTMPSTQKLSEPTGFSQNIVWPKPRGIPYQVKVANYVNLIGHVKEPVQFECGDDGKPFAATVIRQEIGNGRIPLMIPVVFEGDLAHVVSCHVKERDCVFVSGRLSFDPLRVFKNASVVKFHVVAENINFVEGFSGNEIRSSIEVLDEEVECVTNDEEDWKDAFHSTVKISSGEAVEMTVPEEMWKPKEKATLDLWRDLVRNPFWWYDYRGHKLNDLVDAMHPDFKHKGTGEELWVETIPTWMLPGFEKLKFDVTDVKDHPVGGETGAKGAGSWRSLVDDPSKWCDNRLHKTNPRAPDFKHKESGEALWIKDAPPGVITELENLGPVGKDVTWGGKKEAKSEESWRSFLEDPSKWWDNRSRKTNPKAPDFKHKETGVALWLNDAPPSVLTELEMLGSVGKVITGGGKKEAKSEDSWRSLLEDPSKWWDNRPKKRNPRAPDFKHKETGMALWLTDASPGVLTELEMLGSVVKDIAGGGKKEAKIEDSWMSLLEDPSKWWDNRSRKTNPKAPDFKHKETGEAIWAKKLPDWAMNKLPPM